MGSVVFSSYYSLPVTGYATYNVRIGFSEEYSMATNKTKLKITSVELQKEGNGINWGQLPFFGSVKVNGMTLLSMSGGYSVRVSLSGSGYCSVAIPASSEVEILHEDDGSKTVTFEIVGGLSYAGYNHFAANYVQNNTNYPFGARSQSQTVALTTHPRGSSISYCPSTAETQQEIQLAVTRYSSAFYNKATFKIGSTVLYESGAFETSLSYTIPRTWFNSYPNDASLGVTVSVQTYTDQTCTETIGSPATTTMTVNADAGMKPTLTNGWATLAPYNTGAVSGITGYVKGYSKAEATFDSTKITNAAGASIASYSVTCQGVTERSSPYRTPVLAGTSVSVTCTVTDTRGRSASETFPLSVMDYFTPILTEQTVFRCDSQGNPDEDGTYFSVKATLTYASLGGQNTCSLTAAIAAAGGSYGSETSLTSGTASMLGPVSADQSYTVRITATDRLGNSSLWYASVPTRRWAMKFRANGSGVAFGKAPESDGVFEIADGWAVKSRGIVDLIYPVGSLYLSVSGTSPATLFGGIWTRIKDRFLLAAGDVYSAGATGGEAAHTLTTDEMPSHRHYVGAVGWPVDAAGPEHINSNWGSSAWPKVTPIDSTDDAGGGAAHNNMPPYLAVYIWQRTA